MGNVLEVVEMRKLEHRVVARFFTKIVLNNYGQHIKDPTCEAICEVNGGMTKT